MYVWSYGNMKHCIGNVNFVIMLGVMICTWIDYSLFVYIYIYILNRLVNTSRIEFGISKKKYKVSYIKS